jgi:hypothetical protein
MAMELIYTSTERGLRPGSRGFCTVAYTQGMPVELVQILEALSAYKNLYPVHDARAAMNPQAYTHFGYTVKCQNFNIVSRVGPTQADQTQRDNKLGHHVALARRDLVPAGPARLAAAEGMFIDQWDDDPHLIELPKELPELPKDDGTLAQTWEMVANDPGWAGVLAYNFLSRPTAQAYIIYEPGTPVLPLICEAMALVPPDRRWHVTFSTYFFFLPAGTTCTWRCCAADSDAAREARRQPRSLVIDLTKKLPAIQDPNPLVVCARKGLPIPEELQKAKSPETAPGGLPQLRLPGISTGFRRSGDSPPPPSTPGGFLSRWKDKQ